MIVIVMGVSGCGKSTVAAQIAKQMNVEYFDADDLHPPKNKQRMSTGVALTDEDRLPWLRKVRDHAADHTARNQACIIACSALKKSYRDILNQAPDVCYVFLDGPKAVIQQRMHERAGHFMPESLLNSQIADLESPAGEVNVVTVGIEAAPEQIATSAIAALKQANIC